MYHEWRAPSTREATRTEKADPGRLTSATYLAFFDITKRKLLGYFDTGQRNRRRNERRFYKWKEMIPGS